MALQAVVEKLDAIPEALRTEYTEKDGKFYLNLEGGDNLPFVAGLRTALDTERNSNKTVKEAITAWKKIGKTPEEISELVAAKEAAEAEAKKKAGDFDGILKQHQEKWEGEKKTALGERDAALNVARSAVVDSGIKSALVGAKATGEGVALLPRILGDRVRSEFVDGQFVISIVQADGKTPMIGNGPNGSATYDDLIKEAVKNFPSLFEGAGGGGGKPPKEGSGGSGDKTITRGEWDKLTPYEQADKIKAGFKPVD